MTHLPSRSAKVIQSTHLHNVKRCAFETGDFPGQFHPITEKEGTLRCAIASFATAGRHEPAIHCRIKPYRPRELPFILGAAGDWTR